MVAFSVSELNSHITNALFAQFPEPVAVEGEISNFSASHNGHWYFVLKDSSAQISAVMFKNSNSRQTVVPHNGMLVQILGSISFYKERGQCQIICQQISKQGIGSILALLEKRKIALQKEGLFEEKHKKPMPVLPLRIGILTSKNGAALQDIFRTFEACNVSLELVLFHTSVQGENAVPEILGQLKNASQSKYDLDIILITRGGGSTEDLLPYSDEGIVRAIFASSIPVITGVGHEVDTPLCDLVADIRAATPTAAATCIADQFIQTKQAVLSMKNNFEQEALSIIYSIKQKIKQSSLDSVSRELRYRITNIRQNIDFLSKKMEKDVQNYLIKIRTVAQQIKMFLQETSPFAILKKGYALVYRDDGTLVIKARQVKADEKVSIKFSDGKKRAIIKNTE